MLDIFFDQLSIVFKGGEKRRMPLFLLKIMAFFFD